MKFEIALVLALVLVGAVIAAYGYVRYAYYWDYGSESAGGAYAYGAGYGMMGMMGYYPAGEGELSQVKIATVYPSVDSLSKGTVANPENNSVLVSPGAKIVVYTMGSGRAINITGRQPPSYVQGDVFVIDDLIDPVLVFEGQGTRYLEVINLDSSMYHNFVVTRVAPPYPYYSMAAEMWGTAMPLLPPANYHGGYAYAYSYELSLPTGVYWYICTYPGHAYQGMYGRLEVS